MSKELMVAEHDERLAMVEGGVGRVDDEIIDEMIEEANSFKIWVKTKPEGGFTMGDVDFPEITGQITEVLRYWIKWDGRNPEKSFDKGRPGDDWERRCDITIATTGGFALSMSLSKSSHIQLCQYMKALKKDGFHVSDVVTQLTTVEKNSPYGSYLVVMPKRIVSDAPMQTVVKEIEDDEVPF
jgi:hypothetical protein